MIAQILSAVLGVLAFAVLFHAPRRSYVACAICGGFSWGMFLAFTALGLSEFLASTLAIIALTLLAGTRDYNGAGAQVIERAIEGVARPQDFILKLLFTAITLGCGYKGGEIVPTFFVGATFGCVVGPLLGLDPGFAAAIGLVATFCGNTNCPIASVFLGIELFGGQAVPLFAIACAVSYMLSGYSSLYHNQLIPEKELKFGDMVTPEKDSMH